VVRRLVEEKEVRILQEQGGEMGPHPPASGQLRRRAFQVGSAEAEAHQDLLGAMPAVALVVLRKRIVQLRELRADLDLLVRRRRGQLRLRGGDPLGELGPPRNARQHALDEGAGQSPAISCGRYPARALRMRCTLPASGSAVPARIFKSDDFPLPFGPMRPTRSCAPMTKLALSSTTLGP